MRKKLKRETLEANLLLREYGLVLFTWGNASQIDPDRRYVAIKPSGVRYEDLTADDICLLSLEDGTVVEGGLNPSTDAQTHLELYRRFHGIGGIVHTHSTYATAFAQAGCPIPCYGTTHADYFYGDIPCSRALLPHEINGDYELNTAAVIAETFQALALDSAATPAALVCGHGPFTWGKSAADAAANAAYLEETARLAYLTLRIAPPGHRPVSQDLLDKHYNRKHGAGAYYGQTAT